MNKILLNTALYLIPLFFLGGCYTVIWSPGDNTDNSTENNYFYSEYYYGPYYTFYQLPWWLDYNPPDAVTTPKKDRDKTDTGSLRNPDSGRNPGTTRDPVFIPVQPPGRSPGSGNSGNITKPQDNGNKGSSNSTERTRPSGSSNNNTRNNNGSRNSDSGRH